jgi:hypothetical protein
MIAGALLLATAWGEHQSLDWAAIRNTMCGTPVMDGRKALHGTLLSSLGFAYVGIGRASTASAHVNDYFLDLAGPVEMHAVAD